MYKKFLLTIVAVALILTLIPILGGCTTTEANSTPGNTEEAINVTCDEFGQNNHIRKEIEVNAGDTIKVTLCSNPTTGYQWEDAMVGDEAILEETESEYVAPEAEGEDASPAPGRIRAAKCLPGRRETRNFLQPR